MKRLMLLLVLGVLLVCSCENAPPEKKHHGWGFGWEDDSTLIQYRGWRVCTLRVDRETYTGVLGYMPNGHPIYNVPLADTFSGEIDSCTMREVEDSINERIGQ